MLSVIETLLWPFPLATVEDPVAMEHLEATLLKLGLPLLAIVLVLAASRRRGLSWRDDLGLRAPTRSGVLIWLGLWVAWIAATEFVIDALELDQASPWPDYPWFIVALRIGAIGILGPAAEELVMRGALMHLVGRVIGSFGAVFVVAALWAAIHVRYSPATLVLIFADGVLFGFARRQGGSIWLPIMMHVIGNCFSIAQSLAAGPA